MSFFEPRPSGATLRWAQEQPPSRFVRLWEFARNLPVVAAAAAWRRSMRRTTVIAVSGSRGKTTAKNALRNILAQSAPTIATLGTSNGRRGIPRTVLAIRPQTRFAVVEIGVDAPGLMWRGALVVKPDMTVITSVADEHMDNFSGLDAVTAEKQVLVKKLSSRGIAVLNLDDPRVAAMAHVTRARVITFGTSPGAELHAEQVRGAWPERLSFTVSHGGESLRVRTRLVGEHWAPSILAALAAASALGVPLRQSASVVAEMEPAPARLQPVSLPSGATLLRDDFNGSVGTLDTALRCMEQARAGRKVTILSDFTDDDRPPTERLGDIARRVAAVAGLAIFVGRYARIAAEAATAAGMSADRVLSFSSFQSCADYLKAELRAGDLALLKGRNADHLARIYWRMLGPVACELRQCQLRNLCDNCPRLRAAN